MYAEQIEPRLLLAGVATLEPTGVLVVHGDQAPNQIAITSSGKSVVVRVDLMLFEFPSASVFRASVDGMGGHDRIENNTDVAAFLIGGEGDDTLISGSDTDRFWGGQGVNWIHGASASYTLDYSEEERGVTKLLDANQIGGDLRWFLREGPSYDIIDPPPATLTITLSKHVDSFLASGPIDYPGVGLVVDGGAGNDRLNGPEFDFSTQTKTTLVGGPGNDILRPSLTERAIFGGEGDDYLEDRTALSSRPDVHIDMGPGYDIQDCSLENFTGNGTQVFRAGVGVEEFHGPAGIGNYTLMGNEMDNILTAGVQVSVTILGMGGNDTMEATGGGGEAIIRMDGGEGNDLLKVGFDFHTLLGGDGNDTLISREGSDSLDGGEGDDLLLGGDFSDDTLSGGGGNDTLDGQGGTDHLLGDGGDDLLVGNDQELDTLDGGAGFDRAVLNPELDFNDILISIERPIAVFSSPGAFAPVSLDTLRKPAAESILSSWGAGRADDPSLPAGRGATDDDPRELHIY